MGMSDTEQKQSSEPRGVGQDVVLLFVLFFREVIVDFLAILIPGFWFIAASVPGFFLPLLWLIKVCDSGSSPSFQTIFKEMSNDLSGFHTELFYLVLVVSWLVGHLMFRQDQKYPDQMSWVMANKERSDPNKISRACRWLQRTVGWDVRFPIRDDLIKDDVKRKKEFDGMVQPKPEHKNLEEVPVEFPYSHLKDYLLRRGFDQMAGLVTWSDIDKDGRTKNFINAIKAKLEFYHPEKMRELARIESHIRLHSSLWYACFYLRYISILGMACGALANWLLWHKSASMEWAVLIFPTLLYVATFFFHRLIENAFHYQRTREVFFVLRFSRLADGPRSV
jgi:hypothetical protein